MSNRLAGSYSPDRVEVSIGLPKLIGGQSVSIDIPGGLSLPHIVDGRAGDGFFTIGREVALTSKTTGADGEVIAVESKNKSGTLQIVTLGSSTTNTVLSSLLAAWENGIRAYFPITVTDLDDSGSLYEDEQCWIEGWPREDLWSGPR